MGGGRRPIALPRSLPTYVQGAALRPCDPELNERQ